MPVEEGRGGEGRERRGGEGKEGRGGRKEEGKRGRKEGVADMWELCLAMY